MKQNLAAMLVLGALILGGVEDVRGQDWTRVTLPVYSFTFAPYFLNETTGFVSSPNSLIRTTDGGNSWQKINYFGKEYIAQLYFTEFNHGYAASSYGIYETTDTGTTWRIIYHCDPQHACSSVYSCAGKVFAYEVTNQGWGSLLVTDNDGITWKVLTSETNYHINTPNYTNVPPMFPYVFGNKEGVVFAGHIVSNNMSLLYSRDFGNTWTEVPMDIPDLTVTMGLFSILHCNDLFRLFLPTRPDTLVDAYLTVHSSDFGAHWDTVMGEKEVANFIAGNNCAKYLCSAVPLPGGIFRSTNSGNNWNFISTAPDDFDEFDDDEGYYNLSVVGGGSVVYAGTSPTIGGAQLLKTTNGGDGTLSSAAFASKILMTHNLTPASTICDTSFVGLFYENLSCNYTLLKRIQIDGLDSTQFSSQWIHHLACEGMPDTVLIKILPLNSPSNTLNIRAHFLNDEFETIDTSFSVTIAPSGGSSARIYLKARALAAFAGDTIEIPLYINTALSSTQYSDDSVELSYSFNNNLLNPFAFIPISGVTADPVRTTKTTATVTLHFDPSFTFTGETELGRLRCVAYVTDTLETDIALSGVTHSSGCLAALADSNTVHFTLTGCGTPTLSNFMKFGNAYDITSIIPNPAGNSVQVHIENNGSLLHYQLFDVLGMVQKSGVTNGNIVRIDLSGCPSGDYYFWISAEGGLPDTKRVVIVK